MPFSSTQQSKLDAAQKRLDAAKSSYAGWVKSYNDWATSIQPCYKDTIADAGAASTWYNPQKGPCEAKGKCDLSNCKNVIDQLNGTTIPNLRAAYNEQVAAQANYDKVFEEVTAEVKNDPEFISHQNEIAANAQAKKSKWAFWIVVVVVSGGLIFSYLRWFRKTA